MNKFVDIPKRDVDAKAENAWFEKCRTSCVPFITLKSRTKFADVHWDYITYPNDIHKIFDSFGDKLRDDAIAIFMKYANKKSEYTANRYLVWYKSLEIPKAKLAAAELYDLIDQYVAPSCA